MSEQWKLDKLDTTPDVNDVYEGDQYVKTQVRKHYLFERHKLINSEGLSFTSAALTTTANMSAYIGSAEINMVVFGEAKWICTYDGVVPQDDVRVFAHRRQVWEYYGKWEDAPDGWDVESSGAAE